MRYTALMKSLIARARELFRAGQPLAQTVERFLRVDLEMFTGGGLAILEAIEASGYNTLEHRPSLSKWTQAKLLGKTLAVSAFSRGGDSRRAGADTIDALAARSAPDEGAREVAVPRERGVIKLRPYSDGVS